MSGALASLLSGRGVLRIAGEEARSFLQNLVTNNVEKAGPGEAVYSALLTPQGKFLFDFFIVQDPGDKNALLLDCDGARAGDLAKRLAMYKLRAKVTIEDAGETLGVLALWREDGQAFAGPGFPDPRHPAMGRRAILPKEEIEAAIAEADAENVPEEAWHRHRIGLGIGDAGQDFEPDRTFPLEVNFDELNGIDFHKGCYIGQEVTSRTKRRGSVRKRLLPVHVEGEMPKPGTPIKGGVREVGTIFSTDAETERALALIRLDLIRGSVLEAGAAEIRPEIPAWLPVEMAEGDGNGDAEGE